MRSLIILLFIACFTSCAHKSETAVKPWPNRVITYGFLELKEGSRAPMPQEYRAYAEECATEWAKSTSLTLVLIESAGWLRPDIVIAVRSLPKGHVGWAYDPSESPLGGDIDLDDCDWWKDHSREYFKTIMLHEFGHALGLRHSVCKRSIMYKYPRAKSIHSFDVDNLNKGYRRHE